MTPDILALDYYDGALEGFGRRVLDGHDVYFTFVAWDPEQDERLFAVMPLPPEAVDRVFAMYAKADRAPESRVWLPPGRLEVEADNVELEALIARARKRIPSEGTLMVTMHIGATPPGVRRVKAAERERLERVLASRTPDPISNWLL